MASNDLVFDQSPIAQPAQLVFGDVFAPPDTTTTLAATLPGLQVAMAVGAPIDVRLAATMPGLQVAMFIAPLAKVTLAATLPGLQVAIKVTTITPATLVATLPAMTVAIKAVYDSDTARPVVAEPHSGWQLAIKRPVDMTDRFGSTLRMPLVRDSRWTKAIKRPVDFTDRFGELLRLHQSDTVRFSEAIKLNTGMCDGWGELSNRARPALRSTFQNAQHLGVGLLDAWQERFRDRRPTLVSPWGIAQRMGLVRTSLFQNGQPYVVVDRSAWENAIEPPIGTSGPPVIPPVTPCYTPPKGNEVYLVFKDEPGTTDLVFVCEKIEPPPETPTIVVPIKRVYLVNNSSSLHRVDTGQQLPAFAMNLSLDVDSWTWGFSAGLPLSAMPLLARQSDGQPAELAAVINGVEYRVLAEGIRTTRQFGSMPTISLTGRGKQALLDKPYAPITNFINQADINANQLMMQALTVNNVPLGWDVDFQLEDWLVPAHAFALTGSYMGAVTQIAAAAGGYIQPSPVDQTLRALSRYPTAPWNWDTTHIDYELPSDVVTVEGIDMIDKPVYNHVYVSGTSSGVIGSVKRAGTAGDQELEMITDPLCGDDIVARQRGRVALSDVGRQERVTLSLPVLPETGIILPGKMVRYVDTQANKTRIGIVRSMQTAVSQSALAETWQTIGVETHVD